MSFDPFAKLKSDGDFVEQHFAHRIKSTIPSYARIWAEYIGNDGKANALPMPDVNEATNESRSKHWQRFYTILESLALCWDIEEELHRQQEIKNFKHYAQNLNLWMAFYSHLGRIHDMVKAIAGELNNPDLLKPFVDYWKDRHIVLHGPKVPMRWVCNTLAFPAFGESRKHWNDKMLWLDLNSNDFEFISSEVNTILREIEQKLERCFAELRKVLPAKYGWKLISWDDGVRSLSNETGAELQLNISRSNLEQQLGDVFIPASGTGTLPR